MLYIIRKNTHCDFLVKLFCTLTRSGSVTVRNHLATVLKSLRDIPVNYLKFFGPFEFFLYVSFDITNVE